MEAKPLSVELENRTEEMALSKSQHMEDMAGSRWNATKDGGREMLVAMGEVTRTARSGSRNHEMEA